MQPVKSHSYLCGRDWGSVSTHKHTHTISFYPSFISLIAHQCSYISSKLLQCYKLIQYTDLMNKPKSRAFQELIEAIRGRFKVVVWI